MERWGDRLEIGHGAGKAKNVDGEKTFGSHDWLLCGSWEDLWTVWTMSPVTTKNGNWKVLGPKWLGLKCRIKRSNSERMEVHTIATAIYM